MAVAGQRPDPDRYRLIPRTLIFARRGNRILLQQVAPGRGPWAGLWNGVGGHVEPGESPAEAAGREFREETRLDLLAPQLAGTVVVDLARDPGLILLVMVGEAGEGQPVPNQEGRLRWCSPGEIADLPTVSDLPTLLPSALAVLDGAPAFTARSVYNAAGRLITRVRSTTAPREIAGGGVEPQAS